MAKNRKNQAASIRFGPVLKVVLLCSLIGGSAVGYVWQKNEIIRLGKHILEREKNLARLQADNKRLSDQIAILHSPPLLDQRVKELRLGLAPAQPMQVVRLDEPAKSASANNNSPRQFTQRSLNHVTP